MYYICGTFFATVPSRYRHGYTAVYFYYIRGYMNTQIEVSTPGTKCVFKQLYLLC
jgi:hypothetical protein